MSDIPSYEDFENQWLDEIKNNALSTVEKGRKFAQKLIIQWLDISEDTDDIAKVSDCPKGWGINS